MKENIKIKGQLKLFLSWPLLLSLFLISGNITVAALNKTSEKAHIKRIDRVFCSICLDSEAAFGRDGSSLWIGR